MTLLAPQPRRISTHDRLIARLASIAELTGSDLDDIRALPMTVRALPAGRDICREGERMSESLLLIEGMLHRYKEAGSGRRQILAFHVAGDIPDLQTLRLPVMDHTLAAVTDARIGVIPHAALNLLIASNARVAAALWRETLIDAATFRQWIANLGSRNAYQRTAHLFCELYLRLRAVGLAQSGDVVLPLTQIQLSEALGLSVVHMNRTMQALRKDGLIAMDRRTLRILDWERLRDAADFDPAFLHQRNDAAGID